ncbi:MAG: hypothetical protein L3J42_03665 [Hydrogenimonas sp.]|nr:hypothetical protein [Hydrogenimonas sp.]
MNRLLIILFGVLSTTAVTILLILLFRYANENVEYDNYTRGDTHKISKESEKTDKSSRWLQELAGREKPSYSYAVTEMEISLPLKKRSESRVGYKLILGNLDDYKMFCVKQLLERKGVDYSAYRRDGRALLIVHDIDKKREKEISSLLKDYDIKMKIEKYIKD